MTSPAPESGTQTVARAAERDVYRTAARDAAVFLAVLAVAGVAVGALFAGWPGVWGALLGVAFAAFFCAGTIFAMLRTVGESPVAMAAWVMGAWLVKIVVLIAVLAALRDLDFYHPLVLFVVLAIGALGAAFLDFRAVASGRIPYFES